MNSKVSYGSSRALRLSMPLAISTGICPRGRKNFRDIVQEDGLLCVDIRAFAQEPNQPSALLEDLFRYDAPAPLGRMVTTRIAIVAPPTERVPAFDPHKCNNAIL